jgi:uncharacterized protein YndB with AHSA1/START domain
MPVKTAVNSGSFKVTTPSDREIVITRLFNAPRPLVFEAMTKPEHIKRWWGMLEAGYSVPVCEVDLRVGGKWRFVNQLPNGDTVAFRGVYKEIEAPERLVFTEVMEPYPEPGSMVTAVYTEQGDKTLMTVTCDYFTQEVRDMVLNSGMERGAAISYDRLEDVARELQEKRV